MTASPAAATAEPRQPMLAGLRALHPGDLLIPLSFLLWAIGLSRTHVPSVQPYGLITSLPAIYYVGIALLAVSAVLELRRAQVSEWRLAIHAASLVIMLFATAPIVYAAGRYSWLYKTIGVVQYINAHGKLNDNIDIYQNWPGFFALAAWFDKVAGVGSPLAYAKWAQPVFELAALPLLYLIYSALGLPIPQRWLAIFLYSASNWIGQDYLSPQGLGSVLSLGIMALVLRWLYVPRSRARPAAPGAPRLQRIMRQLVPARPDNGLRWWSLSRDYSTAWSLAICATIAAVFYVLSMTHQLSPYMLVVQVGALACAGMLRPRWMPILLAAIAVGYLIPRFDYVNSHFGLLSSIGSFFENVKPPSLSVTPTVSASATTISHCCELLSLGIWCLALAGAWLSRRSRLPVLALLLLAFSPILLLAVQAYGNEGVLRVFLFSLPYCAALGAMALIPAHATAGSAARHRSTSAMFQRFDDSGINFGPVRVGSASIGTARIVVGLLATLALFFPSFFGNDSYNVMPASEVTTLTSFQQRLGPAVIYVATDSGPFLDTANYDLLQVTSIFGNAGMIGNGPVQRNVASVILNYALRTTSRNDPVYVVIAPSMVSYNRSFSVTSASGFTVLAQSLARTPPWQLVLRQNGVVIYELPPDTLPVTDSVNPAPSGKKGKQ